MAPKPRDIYDSIASGRPLHPFDPINDPTLYAESKNTRFYAFPLDKTQESVRRLLAQARVAAIGSEMGARGVERYFCPTPMSGSLAVYQYFLKDREERLRDSPDGWLTVQDPQLQMARTELLNKVVLPSHIASHWKGDRLERKFPDKGVMVVADIEGPIRQVRANQALSGGATWQGPIYEHYWVPSVYRSHGTVLYGDHAVSRHANAEEIAADFIQCGMLDNVRAGLPPGKKYPVVDENNRPVSLTDRAWETAKHVVDVVEHGFKTDFAVNALIARFQIHEWLKDPRHSPLDMNKVHPVLKNRPAEEVERMERLKEIMLPYLADKCMGWFPYENEKHRGNYVEKHVLPHAGSLNHAKTGELRDELFAHRPRGGANTFLHAQYNFAPANDNPGPAEDFSAVARRVKRRGTEGVYFGDEPGLFDLKHQLFKSLHTWEQEAVCFMAGALEATRMPENRPAVWAYSCHPKGGVWARDFMNKKGIDYLREAQGKEDYSDKVIRRNVEADRKLQDTLASDPVAKARGVGAVLSTLDFLEFADAAEKNREFVAAEGKNRLSADAVLALQMEWFDRNATGLVLHKDWQLHHGEVAMMMTAIRQAVGLGPRDAMEGGRFRMEIFVRDPDAPEGRQLKKQSLHDIISTLGEYVEKCADRPSPAPYREGYVALAQLLEIADKLGDPGGMNVERARDGLGKTTARPIIDWGKVDTGFQGFWHSDPQKKADLSATPEGAAEPSLRDRLRTKILEKGISFFNPADLDGLHDEYRKKWQEVKGITGEQARHGLDRAQTRHLDYGSTS